MRRRARWTAMLAAALAGTLGIGLAPTAQAAAPGPAPAVRGGTYVLDEIRSDRGPNHLTLVLAGRFRLGDGDWIGAVRLDWAGGQPTTSFSATGALGTPFTGECSPVESDPLLVVFAPNFGGYGVGGRTFDCTGRIGDGPDQKFTIVLVDAVEVRDDSNVLTPTEGISTARGAGAFVIRQS